MREISLALKPFPEETRTKLILKQFFSIKIKENLLEFQVTILFLDCLGNLNFQDQLLRSLQFFYLGEFSGPNFFNTSAFYPDYLEN